MNRTQTLDTAKVIVNGEREGSYGTPENNFKSISTFWSAYLHHDVTPEDVANMMILLKVARNSSGNYKQDNWVDICGYAAIGEELSTVSNIDPK